MEPNIQSSPIQWLRDDVTRYKLALSCLVFGVAVGGLVCFLTDYESAARIISNRLHGYHQDRLVRLLPYCVVNMIVALPVANVALRRPDMTTLLITAPLAGVSAGIAPALLYSGKTSGGEEILFGIPIALSLLVTVFLSALLSRIRPKLMGS